MGAKGNELFAELRAAEEATAASEATTASDFMAVMVLLLNE